MARWDDLRRAITAKDTDAIERIWFELLEADPSDPSPFLEMADLQSRQTGGKRLAGSLLGLLADAFKTKEHWRQVLPVLSKLASISPEEGTIRKEFASSVEANVIHGSDSPESAALEIPYFFTSLQLLS